MKDTLPDSPPPNDHPLLSPSRLWHALMWWLFWNRESRLSLWWLLRFHRRPVAWVRWVNRKLSARG